MNEITVTSQQQLDNLPHDYHGRIYIKFGTPYDKAIVRRKYDFASVVARGDSSVVAWENSNGKAKLFKAVRKHDGVYHSDWDADFVYTIGESVAADGFCTDPNEDCGRGIHMAYLDWCLAYGNCWTDLAILEVEADMSTVVVPKCGSGKVRAPSCKVIREVPLEECGLYGKALAKRRNGGAA